MEVTNTIIIQMNASKQVIIILPDTCIMHNSVDNDSLPQNNDRKAFKS